MVNALRIAATILRARASLETMNFSLKTFLDRDQYVTTLKNSSHWSDIYFGMARRIQNSEVK